MYKKVIRCFMLFCLALASSLAAAQTQPISKPITATAQCVTIQASNNSVVGIVLTGTWSGTLSPTVKIYGATAGIAKKVTPLDGTAQATITANGAYTAAIGGFTEFDLCSTGTWTSGTATVQLYATPANNVGALGGGGVSAITAVNTGAGLSGGGSSGSLTLVNTAPVVNQVKGQLTVGGATPNVTATSPGEVWASTWCGDFSGATCPGFVTEAEAMRAIVTSYGCTTALGGSCNLFDDLSGIQYWDESPLPTNFTGKFTITTNGPAHQIFLDGTSTVPLPTDTTFEAMGGTSSDQIAENSAIILCNVLTDNCPGGGFQTQSTLANTNFVGTPIGLSVTGSVMTVTLTAGAPFSVSANAINQLAVGRWMCITQASTNADNGCFMVGTVISSTAPQSFTLNIDSANQVTCASPCGTAGATLETYAISFGAGGGNGIFHTRAGNFILDGHGVVGAGAIVNGQGEEGVGTDSSIQMYNFPMGCFRLENSGIFGGNGSTGTTNSGPYGAMACNFNPWIVTKVAGAPCSNNGVGACSGGLVPAGSPIAIGAGTNSFGVLSPSPVVNPNWWGLMIAGTVGQGQGQGQFERFTISDQDKTATNAEVFPHLGASQPIGAICAGSFCNFGHIHTEFVRNGFMLCPDSAISATVQETYGGIQTSANLASGFASFASGGIGVDIGQSGGGANCGDVNLLGVNIGGGSGTILKDNITGHTITGSATEQSETYLMGHGTNPGWYSSAPGVGIGSHSFNVLGGTSGAFPITANATSTTVNIGSANATVTTAGALTVVSCAGCNSTLGAANPQTATYPVVASDFSLNKNITVASGTFTITLVASGSQPPAGQAIRIINYGSGVITIAVSGQNVNGAATSLSLPAANTGQQPVSAYIESDGTNYFAEISGANAATLGGKTFAVPNPIGNTTPNSIKGTTVTSGTAGTTAGFIDLGAGYLTAAMGAQSSATCTNITNMTWAIAANKNYIGHCQIPMTFAASATVAFCLGGPGTPTAYNLNAIGSIGLTAAYDDINVIGAAAYGTKTTASGAVGVSTTEVLVDFAVRNGATASGTALTLQTAGNGTNTFTVGSDATCTLTQVN